MTVMALVKIGQVGIYTNFQQAPSRARAPLAICGSANAPFPAKEKTLWRPPRLHPNPSCRIKDEKAGDERGQFSNKFRWNRKNPAPSIGIVSSHSICAFSREFPYSIQ
jgi:hypothetical protein